MIEAYILDGKTPVRVDVDTWGKWLNTGLRIVAKTDIGDVQVSTVFIGLDHSLSSGGPPLLFETMIFGGEHDQYQRRCSTWDEAEKEHAKAVAMVRGS